MRRRLCLTAAAALILAAASAAEIAALSDYVVANWQTIDGLPQSSVNGIDQTPDGYFWLATFGGVARFDGVRFAVFNSTTAPGLPEDGILRLYADRSGALWAVTVSHKLVRYKRKRFEVWSQDRGVPKKGVERVGEDAKGRLWMADRDSALYLLRNGRFEQVLGPGGFAQGAILEIVNDGEGFTWFKQGDTAARFDEKRWIRLPARGGGKPAVVKHLTRRRAGGLWVVTPEGLEQYSRGKWIGGPWKCPSFKTHFQTSAEDLDGNLWLGAFNDGVYRFSPGSGWSHYTVGRGLNTRAVRCVYVDREGSVWVGTDGGGLSRFRPRRFHVYGLAAGLPENLVRAVSEDSQGRVWLAVKGEPLGCLENGRWRRAPAPLGAPVLTVLADRAGRVWAGSYKPGLFVWDGQRLARHTEAAGGSVGAVQALFNDRKGAIWAGDETGVVRFAHGSLRRCLGAPGPIFCLGEDARGRLYAGSVSGLYRLEEGRFEAVGGAIGEPVRALCGDERGNLWFATPRGGLRRLREGKIARLGPEKGVPNPVITGLTADGNGSLWVAGERGILQLRIGQLETLAQGKSAALSVVSYGREDGLITPQCSDSCFPSIWKGRRGRLWFATAAGATVVNLAELERHPCLPLLRIESMRFNGRVVGGDDAPLSNKPVREIRLRAESGRVEFQFTALSFAAPEKMRFRHKLEGIDPDWIDDGPKRQAVYTSLPPGRYRFHVQACNHEGVWNTVGASLAFEVIPPWWRTGWAYLGEALAAAGALVWFYERRMRRAHRLRQLQEDFSRRLIASQEAERRRVAGELHDDLGQELLLIKNWAAMALESLNEEEALRDQLIKISDSAGRALQSVRALTQDLRPYELDRLGLNAAVESMVERLSSSTGLRCRVQFTEPPEELSPETRTAVYRILQESFNNIVRHAQAAEAFLETEVSDGFWRVRLADNGRGFDLKTAPGGNAGQGLGGIRERARLIGARLRIQSRPGAGTALILELPLKNRAKR